MHKQTVIANTFIMMKYKLFPLFLTSFLLFSCQPIKKQAQPLPLPQENVILPNPMKPTTPIERMELPEDDPDVWDLKDVDTSYIDPNRKLICFTFDDAPTRISEDLLAVFASFNEENPDCGATATIFYNGSLFDESTEHLLHATCALGLELGNHTHSHFDLTTLSSKQLIEEIEKTDMLLEKIDGKKNHLLRAPYGKFNDLVRECAPAPLLHWKIDTLDWSGISAEEIYETIYSNRFDGAIVLMHDGKNNTVSAVKQLLPDLKADGYQVVSVSTLAKMHNCILRKGKVYVRLRQQK